MNLIKAGYEVTVWNRSADKCAALQAAGAKVRRAAVVGRSAGWGGQGVRAGECV